MTTSSHTSPEFPRGIITGFTCGEKNVQAQPNSKDRSNIIK